MTQKYIFPIVLGVALAFVAAILIQSTSFAQQGGDPLKGLKFSVTTEDQTSKDLKSETPGTTQKGQTLQKQKSFPCPYFQNWDRPRMGMGRGMGRGMGPGWNCPGPYFIDENEDGICDRIQ